MIEPSLTTRTPPPEEDVTTTLYRAAIGPVSSAYYLPIFTRFEAADHAGISWNSAASLLTLNWLVFRKLWVAALAYVGILVAVALLVFGIARLVFQFSDTLMITLSVGFGLAAFVLPGLFGNALFHTECRKAMAKALTGHANVADARDALLAQASSRKRLIALGVINAVVVLVFALAYQQFSSLSHVAVLPHGALEAGNVAVGRTTDTASPTRMLPSAPASAPVSAASAAGEGATTAPAIAMAASVPVSVPASATGASAVTGSASAPSSALAAETPASAPALAPVASQPLASASMPTVPTASASSPTASAPTAPPPAKAASASKAKTKAQTPSTKSSTPASAAAAQVRTTKDPEKTKAAKKPNATAAGEPAKKASAAASSQAAVSKSFFINVGLFSVPENAAKAHAKLLEAGLPSVMKELKAKTRQIRVRVGPYSNQTQAEAAAEKIKALQLEASIVQL